jgi:hypothetical protein
MYVELESQKELDRQKLFEEIMAGTFPNVIKAIESQVQELPQNSSTRNREKTIARHIIMLTVSPEVLSVYLVRIR